MASALQGPAVALPAAGEGTERAELTEPWRTVAGIPEVFANGG